jgi:hypothetical protein
MNYIAKKYIQPTRGGVRFETIRNDCVIRAMANATGIDYMAIERFAIEKCDYKRNGTGMHLPGIVRISEWCGMKLTHIVGTTNAANSFKHLTMYKRDEIEYIAGRTIENVLPMLKNGRYAVHIRVHIFAVIDGNIIDTGYMSKNQRVTAIFKF